jgi:hypothetical protein
MLLKLLKFLNIQPEKMMSLERFHQVTFEMVKSMLASTLFNIKDQLEKRNGTNKYVVDIKMKSIT